MTTLPPTQEDSRYAAVRQYSLAQILAVWAAAAIPMAILLARCSRSPLVGDDVGHIRIPFLGRPIDHRS